MDVVSARTFVEIVNAGSFVGAATRLNVTQSTISMRVRALEDKLGRRLFQRNRAGAVLTPSGVQFQRYAIAFCQLWEQANHDIAVPPGFRGVLSIGGQFSLWDGFLLRWLNWLRIQIPDISLRADYGQPDWLMLKLVEGLLDIGVMYTPQSRPGLKVERLLDEELVLVATPDVDVGPASSKYVLVDWSPEFRSAHSLHYPDASSPGVLLALGSHGLKYVLENGGSGYFPERVVQPYINTNDLVLIEEAPTFSHTAYLVYSEFGDVETKTAAIEGLFDISNSVQSQIRK